MGNEEMILKKLDKIDMIITRLDKLETKMDSMETRMDSVETKMDSMETKMDSMETKMDSMETKMDSMETKMDSMETKMDSMETRMDSMHDELKEFKEETNLNFIKAEGERGYLDKELSKTNAKVSELQGDVTHIKETIHVIQTKLGCEQDVPKISVRLGSVETVVSRHTDQIDSLNRQVGLA